VAGLAIGEVRIGGRARGTAFVVTDDLLLTCRHCVRDRPAGAPITVTFAPDLTATVVLLQDDEVNDVALLGFRPPFRLPAGWSPVALGRDDDAPREAAVDVTGWPLDRITAVAARTLPCRVEQQIVIGAGTTVLQLYADQLIGGVRPRGFSGSPALARTPAGPVAVGVARWMQEADDDPETVVGGVVYATRVSDVTARWPALRPVSAPALDLAGDLQAPSRLAVEDFVTAQLRGPGGDLPFAGRVDDLAALDGWLDEPDAPPHHLVSGPAGIGKSTLLVRWAARIAARRDLHVVLVPISVRYETNEAREALLALVHRLSRVHQESYDRTMSAADARQSVRALLSRPAPAGTRIVVIIDALDEAAGWTPGPRLFPQQPGAGVRLLLSARHTGEHPNAAAWTGELGLPGARTTTLSRLGAPAMAGLLRQALPDASAADLDAAAARLWSLTDGEPVTVALHLQAITAEPGGLLAAWTANAARTPPGLAGFFAVWWKEQRTLWSGHGEGRVDDAERLLRILVIAEGPVTRADLLTLAGRLRQPLDGVRVDAALTVLSRFVLPGRTGGTVVVAHQVITDMLRDRLEKDGSATEYRQAFVSWGVDILDRLHAGDLSPGEVPTYLARHLSGHLTSQDTFHPYAPQLAGPLWRRVKDAAGDDIGAFRADVETVASHARRLDQQRRARGEEPRLLPERVICAAEIAAEQRALGTGMSAALATELVRHGLWRPGRALGYLATTTHPGLSDRAYGVAALAPVIPVEDLPALEQLLDEAQRNTYSEELAAAISVWAVRLYELGHVAEALQAAFRLPEGHDSRRYVAIWTLTELIARMPDDLAAGALATVVREITESDQQHDDTYAIGHLTATLHPQRAERLGLAEPAAFMIGKLDRYSQRGYGDTPFVYLNYLQHHAFVAAAPWMPEEQVSAIIRWALFDRLGRDPEAEVGRYEQEQVLLPGINYDGLLSVLPAADADEVATWVRAELTGAKRLCCLAQLLPLLDPPARQDTAAEIAGAAPQDLKAFADSLNMLTPAVPAMVRAGCTDLIVDLIERTGAETWLIATAAEHLTLEQARDLMPIAASAEFHRSRKELLVRRAATGPREADAVLEEIHGGRTSEVSGELGWLLNTHLPAGHLEEPPEHRPLTAWWTAAYWGSTSPGGERRYPPTGPRLEPGSGSGPWFALCRLAAVTRRPPVDHRDAALAEIRSRIGELREIASQRGSVYPFPPDSPWLAGSVDGWTPFFVRLLAPDVRPLIRDLLFDGGYGEGVEGPEHNRGRGEFDDWAREALTLTPLFSAKQMALLEERADTPRIDSGTLRAYVKAGLAVGYAHHGDRESAYRVLYMIGGPDPAELKQEVLAEVLYLLDPSEIVEWAAQVHRNLGTAILRGPVWGHLSCRLDELSDDQMWTLIDRWLTEHARGSRFDVLADVLLYRAAIARLAGRSECARMLTLINA
jgi:hypothetical protein